jgi:glycosyltransferase involved in cell wall biosynthesis
MRTVKTTMRILHIWDQAAVACKLAKYQRLQGHESTVITPSGYYKYGVNNFYSDYIFAITLENFVDKCIEEAEPADIIHVHSRIDILFKLREKFGRTKKIILQYHGSDIRGFRKPKELAPMRTRLSGLILKSKGVARRILRKSKQQMNIKAQRLADEVLVSTPDLLRLVAKGIYLPIPVDTDHFKPYLSSKNYQKEALTINTEVTDIKWALNYCKEHGINPNIEVYDRVKNPKMYADMPNLLTRYKVYVDIRYVNEKILENLSTTALEALACGLKVLDYQLKYRQGLPEEHEPINVVSRLSSIYTK